MHTSEQLFSAARNLREFRDSTTCPILRESLSDALARLTIVATDQALHEIKLIREQLQRNGVEC